MRRTPFICYLVCLFCRVLTRCFYRAYLGRWSLLPETACLYHWIATYVFLTPFARLYAGNSRTFFIIEWVFLGSWASLFKFLRREVNRARGNCPLNSDFTTTVVSQVVISILHSAPFVGASSPFGILPKLVFQAEMVSEDGKIKKLCNFFLPF